jgi:hypothetical protein
VLSYVALLVVAGPQVEPAPKQQEQPGGHHQGMEDPLLLPPHGTEIFIGGIPRAVTEAEFHDFAAQAGEVSAGHGHGSTPCCSLSLFYIPVC